MDCWKCHGRGVVESRDGFGVDPCGYCDAHALNKAEMAKAAVSAVAITRAVEAWREVPEEERRCALLLLAYERDRMTDPQNVRRLAALTRAADLLRTAGGTP